MVLLYAQKLLVLSLETIYLFLSHQAFDLFADKLFIKRYLFKYLFKIISANHVTAK